MTEPPTNIRAHQADQVLELGWDDHPARRVPYRTIRGQCPCASCRDEWTGERLIDASTLRDDLRLEGMEAVGNYAVRLSWNDGHSSGLYTWDLLRELAASPDPQEVAPTRWMGIDPPGTRGCGHQGHDHGQGCGHHHHGHG